jgi:gluconate 2-dehydrogenase gamma chain
MLVGGTAFVEKQSLSEVSAARRRSALTPNETQWLIAAVARLIPADASGGGAIEARAHVYIDRALTGAYAKFLPVYRSGLAALQALAHAEGAHDAREMSPIRLDAILARMESGAVKERLTDASHSAIDLATGGAAFFNLLLRHSVEGTFGDPVHGGNHNFIGWKLIGYSGLQLFYSESEQAMNAPKDRPNRSVSDFGRKSDV